MSAGRGDVRPAAVAGLFYPGRPDELRATVRDLLERASERRGAERAQPAAIVVPHAGYVYSGSTAAAAFDAVPHPPARVVLVGPAHRVRFAGISAADYEAYAAPTGALPVDRAQVAALEAGGATRFVPAAHAEEHCLEVMVPFILERFGEVPVVPLLVGGATPAAVERALDLALRLCDLLLISTDLTHFLRYDEARRRDLATLDDVVAGRWGDIGPEDACGHRGLAGAMRLGARRGWAPTTLEYLNSGDTAGDRSRVVGYGAVAFHPASA